MNTLLKLEGYDNTETGNHFQLLQQEVIEVLQGGSPQSPYHTIEQDASHFATLLAEELHQREHELLRISDQAPLTIAEHQRPYDYATILRQLLSSPESSRVYHQRFLSQGADPFAAFEGRWVGVWFHNNQAVGAFDHHWQKTQALSDKESLLIQPVVMGRISMEEVAHPRRKAIGSDSMEPTPAVDAASRRSGWIIGAVGFEPKTQRASRPHVGYLWTPELLLWVALETNGSPEEPRYSCFFERRYKDGSYRILGAQLLWHREKRRLTFESFMGSAYQSPRE
jgi:hypothetical protein